MSEKPRIIVLTGPSGSGKSTLRDALVKAGQYAVASADDFLMDLAEKGGISYQEAYATRAKESEAHFQAVVQNAYREKQSLVVDRTSLTPEKRMPFVQRFKKAGFEVIAAVPDLDVFSPEGREELLARAAARMDRGAPMPGHVILAQIEAYEVPTEAEGFDQVFSFAALRGDDPDLGPGQF